MGATRGSLHPVPRAASRPTTLFRSLEGLRIALCQVRVVPGRPDRNVEAILREIAAAEQRSCDLVAFPEMAVPGYLIGDAWEDEGFVRDVASANDEIRAATAGGIAAVWGSLLFDPGLKNEDGRLRKYNAAFVAQGGELVTNGVTRAAVKSLLPRYRFFDDARHFTSTRQLVEESREAARGEAAADPALPDLHAALRPFPVRWGRGGRKTVPLGVLLCEDMWHDDYPFDPSEILVANGARLLLDLSASPWTWQKNRKRDQVVRAIVERCRVPFVFLNTVGLQNNGKNLVVFDGASAVYAPSGDVVVAFPAHEEATRDVVLSRDLAPVAPAAADDSRELFESLSAALREFLSALPPERRKAIVGLSGGIDSATVTALLVHVLGPSNVTAVSMPSRFNGPTTLGITGQIASSLGIELVTVPIQEMVDQLALATGVTPADFAYENVQARARMQILATLSQKSGALFTCNGNKVEIAFGYSTLYGDQSGAIAPIGDLVKREVRQLATYLNERVFGREAIPKACIDMRPSAELSAAQSVEEGKGDPFDYGTVAARGYHDEMVRAFTEFRKGPEWFLSEYAAGRLEATLLLPAGTLARLFPTPSDFVADLEDRWGRFAGSVFKRVQAPPIPIVSRRAFGFDLRESMLPALLTRRYREIRQVVLSRYVRPRRIAVYGGSFNPPGRHHQEIARRLAARFDAVFVVPCWLREDKASVAAVAPEHRRRMAELAFGGIAGLELDLTDMEQRSFTPTFLVEERFAARFPKAEVWHVVGGDLVAGGGEGASEIQRSWQKGAEIWQRLRFAILTRGGSGMSVGDLPPRAELVDVSDLVGSGTEIRRRLAAGTPVRELLDPAVESYVRANGLYAG